MLTEVLADPALDAITRHGTARCAHAHCEPESWVIEPVHQRGNQEERIG